MARRPSREIIRNLERKTEDALLLDILDRMEAAEFWLYTKEGDSIGPLTNYMDWIKLAEIVRKRLK